MSAEKKYLEKIENDIQERLYDLLMMHLMDVHTKVRKSGENGPRLVQLLEHAITQLRNSIKPFNKLQYYRYIIICCNKILTYDTQRQNIKDLKVELIADFTHSEEDQGDFIPLNYQMNEIRITYDAGYMAYLMQKFVKEKLWDKALYCLIAVKLIEPDNEHIDSCYSTIKKNTKSEPMEKIDFGEPKDMTLALDSNVVISHIFKEIKGFRFNQPQTFDLEKIGNNNKFLVTKSVKEEVLKHIDYKMVGIKATCRKFPQFKANEIEIELHKRLDKLCSKYGCDKIDIDSKLIKDIKKMYLSHLDLLEKILMAKIEHKFVSHKLRKLAQRESMLPEEGDIKLLAEVIILNNSNNYGILSNDKDFTEFKAEILEKFKIKVY